MKALTFSKFGGSEVLEYREVPKPIINKDEVLVELKAIGLNFADIYRRKGNYHLKGNPPFIAGYEGAGVVIESNVASVKIGDRVAFADVPFANAEFTVVPEANIIELPETISFETASSVLLQGLTAQYLTEDSYLVSDKDVVLIHAAAGGVGQFLVQMCKSKGAKVIGLTRDVLKKQQIQKYGADLALTYNEDWKEKVFEFTGHNGVSVAYDSVGTTLETSFEVTKECGTVVFYGMSGGDPGLINPRMLMDTSKTLTGGDLWSFLKTKKDRVSRAEKLFDAILSGKIKINDPVRFKLEEGAKAHDFLEQGKGANKVLLIP